MTRKEFDSVVWGMIKLFTIGAVIMVALFWAGAWIYIKATGH